MNEIVMENNTTYAYLFHQIVRKMTFDLEAGKIDIDEFRRIGRGLNDIENYLEYKHDLGVGTA